MGVLSLADAGMIQPVKVYTQTGALSPMRAPCVTCLRSSFGACPRAPGRRDAYRSVGISSTLGGRTNPTHLSSTAPIRLKLARATDRLRPLIGTSPKLVGIVVILTVVL